MARPQGTGGKARPLTRDEVERIDKCLSGTPHEERNRVIFYMGLGTGMRIAELVGLRVSDVAQFGKVLDHIVLERHSTKGKRSRTPMPWSGWPQSTDQSTRWQPASVYPSWSHTGKKVRLCYFRHSSARSVALAFQS